MSAAMKQSNAAIPAAVIPVPLICTGPEGIRRRPRSGKRPADAKHGQDCSYGDQESSTHGSFSGMFVRAEQGRDVPDFRVQRPFLWNKTGPGANPKKFVYPQPCTLPYFVRLTLSN